MARTAPMKLVELMVLKQDISTVIEYIGKKSSFQFQSKKSETKSSKESSSDLNINQQFFAELKKAALFLNLDFSEKKLSQCSSPSKDDYDQAAKFLASFNDLQDKISAAKANSEKLNEAYKEAMAFSNLQVSYAELENLSFLSLRIGKIAPENYESLKDSLEDNAILVPLGDDKSRILVASSKKGRFALDTELKNHGFVNLDVPSDFKGLPQNVLDGMKKEKDGADAYLEQLEIEKSNFSETHKDILSKLIGNFAIAVQISQVESSLESTELVYRITGWIPFDESKEYIKNLEALTEGRIAIRQYDPHEVPSVISGKEKVPVKLKHGKFVSSFERMIFSYGSPVYGTIDPTPYVALFFTILFGIMFGDLGQGMVLLLAGILMAKNIIKVGAWNKFSPIFIAIGLSSSVMGLLTGEVFSNETLLEPFSHWVTGFFGTPHAPILQMMPSSDPNSIKIMFSVFGVAVGLGFIINTVGLIINIVNSFLRKKYSEALFGKNGLAGAIFFWYVVFTLIRVFAFGHSINALDWTIIVISLFFAAFAEPFERAIEKEKPLLENGFGTYVISGLVELIEVISGYLSNTISFVRVGAFALSHAVLDFLVLTLTEMCGPVGGIFVLIAGNAIIIVLEGMVVAIQVIRLQYYEFFSKFFNENGEEFKPFSFSLNLED